MIIMDIPNHTIYKDFDNNTLQVVSTHPLVGETTHFISTTMSYRLLDDYLFYHKRVARSLYLVYATREDDCLYFLVDILNPRFHISRIKEAITLMECLL